MRWPAFLRRKQWDEERARELDAYLEQETGDNIARGMTADAARDASRRKLGNTTLIREEIYRRNSLPVLDTLARHLRYALRQLRRTPVFSVAAILSLALGIGATTAIFTLIDRILLRPLPVREPNALVALRYREHPGSFNQGSWRFSWPLYRALRDENPVLEAFGRFALPLSVSEKDWTDRVEGELVTGNYFEVLGIPAALGRTFTPSDDQTVGGHPLAVLSYDYWTDRFASDTSIVGRMIRVNDRPLTVIGVSARGFDGIQLGYHPKVRIPVTMKREMTGFFGDIFPPENKDALWLEVYGRLNPSVTREQAKATLLAQMQSYQASVGIAPDTTTNAVEPIVEVKGAAQGRSDVRDQFGTPLFVLMVLVGLVLLMASLNVANLLLARATTRRREIAVRLAVGASRRHVVLQLLVESMVLAIIGGAAGLLFASWTNQALLRLIPVGENDLTLPTAPDVRILGFTALVCVGTSLLFGLIPALGATRLRLLPALKDAVAAGPASSRGRNMLVGMQVFFSVLLLMSAGLFVRTLANLRSQDVGFRTEGVLSFTVNPSTNGYRHERAVNYFRSLLEEVRSVPGVESAALGTIRLLDEDSWSQGIFIDGYAFGPEESNLQSFNMVSTGYFPTLGIPLLEGREFTAADAASGHQVAVVNQDMARKYYGSESAVGRTFRMNGPNGTPVEIIGVIGETKYSGIRDTTRRRQVFLNSAQHTDPTYAVVYVKTRLGPTLFPSLRSAARRIDPSVPTFAERTLVEQLNRNLATERLLATLAAAFGVMATALAAVGLYGIMAFTVAGRRKEIGLRLALGARAPGVARLVLRDVVRVVLVGILAAVPAAFLLSRYVKNQLYGVTPNDSVTMLGVAGLLLAVVALACVAPLRRAFKTSPMTVLRED
jgi:predicted permease